MPLETLQRGSDVVTPDVLLTPRIGCVTRETYAPFFTQVVEHVLESLDGRVPERALNPEALARRGARRP